MLIAGDLAPPSYLVAQKRNLGLILSPYLSVLVLTPKKFSYLSTFFHFAGILSVALLKCCSDGDRWRGPWPAEASSNNSQLGAEALSPRVQEEHSPAQQLLRGLEAVPAPDGP